MQEVQRDRLDVLRQDVVGQIVADLADVRRVDIAREPAMVAGQVDGVAAVLQARAECGDGVAEGDADGVDGVGVEAVGDGHGRRLDAVVEEGELVADEECGVVGEVGDECDGLGVDGKNGRILQQETFEKMERGARERRKSVWSTAAKRGMMPEKELTALSRMAVSGMLRMRKRW